MALPGPEPKETRIGHSPTAEWTNVIDEPFLAGEIRELPPRVIYEEVEEGVKELVEAGWTAQTQEWWRTVRILPHAVLWREADWLFAMDTAVLKDKFYTSSFTAADAAEMRRREDLMGTTLEARRKLRIRYVRPVITDAEIHKATEVFAVEDRRRRLLEE